VTDLSLNRCLYWTGDEQGLINDKNLDKYSEHRIIENKFVYGVCYSDENPINLLY
jgi:hypothetical protein